MRQSPRKMKNEEIKITPQELKDILKEYEYNPDPMVEEDDRVRRIKKAISKLSDPDRIIWCLYMDTGASRKVGAILGVSHSTVLKEVKRIKEQIRLLILEDNDND